MMTLLTPYEVADILKISYEKALYFIKYSGIEYIKIGRQFRVEESVLLSFLREHCTIASANVP